MIEPVTPENFIKAQIAMFPDEVIETWNRLIAENYRGNSATIFQDDAIVALQIALSIDRATIFVKGYLEIEPMYRKAGWIVEYDKPAYNESYKAYFKFSKK